MFILFMCHRMVYFKRIYLFLLFNIYWDYVFSLYEGYHVIDVKPLTEENLRQLHHLALNDAQLDFWTRPRQVGRSVRLMVSGDYLVNNLNHTLEEYGMAYTVDTDDMQRVIDQERADISARRLQRGRIFDLDNFNDMDEINMWLKERDQFCRETSFLKCTLQSLGRTHQMQDIMLFTVTASDSELNVPILYIDSGTHAREWITMATNLKIINHLFTGYESDDDVNFLLTNREFHFVVVVNPDGYRHSWEYSRMHRKNLAPHATGECNGTDLNRNFDFKWGQNGNTAIPCYQTYRGDEAGSELETQAIMEHLIKIAPRTRAMLTLHSFGNIFMHSWGTTVQPNNDLSACEIAEDHEDLFNVAAAAARELNRTSGQGWEHGNSCVLMGPTAGATDDFAKGVAGIKYSFTAELRGTGFIIGAENIEPSFQEIWAAIVAMDKAIDDVATSTSTSTVSSTESSTSSTSSPATTTPPVETTEGGAQSNLPSGMAIIILLIGYILSS